VPKGLTGAEVAQDILRRNRIDLDDPNNGAWLEGPGGIGPDPSGRASHGGVNGPVHRVPHLDSLNERLTDAEKRGGGVGHARDEILAELRKIQEELYDGFVSTVA